MNSGANIMRAIYITALKRGDSERGAQTCGSTSSPDFSRGDIKGSHDPSPHLQMGDPQEHDSLPRLIILIRTCEGSSWACALLCPSRFTQATA